MTTRSHAPAGVRKDRTLPERLSMDKSERAKAPDVGALLPARYVSRENTGEAGLALAASVCTDCNKPVFPASEICPFCLSTEVHPLRVEGPGTLYSFTTVHTGPDIWETPYSIGYADFECGVRVFAKLAARENGWKLDMPVRLVVREMAPDSTRKETSFHYFFEAAN
jgi:uncharacterized OB-fold protein